MAKVKGHRFDAFDCPRPLEAAEYVGRGSPSDNQQGHLPTGKTSALKGRFF